MLSLNVACLILATWYQWVVRFDGHFQPPAHYWPLEVAGLVVFLVLPTGVLLYPRIRSWFGDQSMPSQSS